MTRYTAAALGAALLLVGTACGSTRLMPVPDVTGERLDLAQDTLDASGLHYRTEGGGAFGIVVRSHWFVCQQSPPPKTVATSVTLAVARSCSIPDVVGKSLEDAEDELRHAGIESSAHSLEDKPILVESFWTVCDQSPPPGASSQAVELYVARDCWEYES